MAFMYLFFYEGTKLAINEHEWVPRHTQVIFLPIITNGSTFNCFPPMLTAWLVPNTYYNSQTRYVCTLFLIHCLPLG